MIKRVYLGRWSSNINGAELGIISTHQICPSHQKMHCLHVSATVDYFLVSTLAISFFFAKFIIFFTLIIFTSWITKLYSSCKLLYRIFYSSINHNGQNDLSFLFCHKGGIALSLMPTLRCY